MMSADPEGYYSDLGISPSATADEIRAIYRALAKIYHPDVNPDPAAPARFRRFTTAYEVLSDPERRAAYDAGLSGGNRTAGPQPPPETEGGAVPPIECSVCRKTTVQPRFLIFRHVISAILVTRITTKPGVYCSRCASKTALRASAISAALGWWGLPWGPISTIKEIARNVRGGERNPDIDEQLLWQNAMAFFQEHKLGLAASLAFYLRSAADDKIAKAARQLLQFLSWNGVKAEKLTSAWAFRPGSAIGQVLLGAIVPIAVFFLVAITSYIGSDGQGLTYAHLPSAGSVAPLPHSDLPAPIPSMADLPVPPAPTEQPNPPIAVPPAPDDVSPAVPPAAKSAAYAAPSDETTRCCKDQARYLALEFDIAPKSAIQLKSSLGPWGPFDRSSYTLPSTFRKGQDRILPDNSDEPPLQRGIRHESSRLLPCPYLPGCAPLLAGHQDKREIQPDDSATKSDFTTSPIDDFLAAFSRDPVTANYTPPLTSRKRFHQRHPDNIDAQQQAALLPPAVAQPATGQTGYVVQLATFRSEDEAAGEFRRLQSQHPQLVGTLQQRIQRAELGASGTFYRLGVGPLSTKDQAHGLCKSFVAAGEKDCLVRSQ